jgi:hypothetical protein
MSFSGRLSYFSDVLDDVEKGVSEATVFANKVALAAAVVFGKDNPVGNAIASVNADIQKVAALIQVPAQSPSGAATPGALVATSTIFTTVWDTVEEAVKSTLDLKNLPSNTSFGAKADVVLEELLPIVIPLGLAVVPGGGAISLAAPTIVKMVSLILANV